MANNTLDKSLQEIIKARLQLSNLEYNSPSYDDMEEKLHEMEDSFQDEFGDILEVALKKVHDQYCPDTDVLLPIAYIGKKYKISEKNEYTPHVSEGISVEMEDSVSKDAKLIIVPNPPRIVLSLPNKELKTLLLVK